MLELVGIILIESVWAQFRLYQDWSRAEGMRDHLLCREPGTALNGMGTSPWVCFGNLCGWFWLSEKQRGCYRHSVGGGQGCRHRAVYKIVPTPAALTYARRSSTWAQFQKPAQSKIQRIFGMVLVHTKFIRNGATVWREERLSLVQVYFYLPVVHCFENNITRQQSCSWHLGSQDAPLYHLASAAGVFTTRLQWVHPGERRVSHHVTMSPAGAVLQGIYVGVPLYYT